VFISQKPKEKKKKKKEVSEKQITGIVNKQKMGFLQTMKQFTS
jgi:hypothetical protein